ncbi:MAG: hypothetical protein KatS3mg131_0211 [Candidatus Tectimicrobiota bacterium]|nr:MAG: hypothetical protein KatS3mg131_0211 [Candidatus Tectomicrobia bacterium]
MAHCLATLLSRGFAGAVLIGSDLPTLPVAYLQHAVSLVAMPHVDVVLGPSTDGGYYLVGMRQLHAGLFAGVPWSTAAVWRETQRRATALGLRVATLPAWYDVDRAADLPRLRHDLQRTADPTAAHTRRLLLAVGQAAGR